MDNDVEIHGFCDERFHRVGETFAYHFEKGLEVGASLAITVDGEYAVDLWGGHTSYTREETWGRDTIVVVYSTTKIMTSLCALMLVDQGNLDLDSPVAKYWPEFGQAGKEGLPVRYILSHSAGLPGFDEPIPYEALYDWDRIVGILARQKPWWEPGTASAYHGQTFGFLVGELVRRVSGVTIGTFFRTEVAERTGADFHIGLPEEHLTRVAEPVWAVEMPAGVKPDSIGAKLQASPLPALGSSASREFRMAELPSNNGHGNARSVARVGSILAMSGELDGIRFLSRDTIGEILEEQIYVTDYVFGEPVRYGLGYGLPSKEFPLPNPNALHWGGSGGSFCIMDLDARVCCAYAMNHMLSLVSKHDPRNVKLREALTACMVEM